MASKIQVTAHKMLTLKGNDIAYRLYCEKDNKQKIYDVTLKALEEEGVEVGLHTLGPTSELKQYEENGLFMTQEEFEGKEKAEDVSHNKLKVKMLVKLILGNNIGWRKFNQK